MDQNILRYSRYFLFEKILSFSRALFDDEIKVPSIVPLLPSSRVALLLLYGIIIPVEITISRRYPMSRLHAVNDSISHHQPLVTRPCGNIFSRFYTFIEIDAVSSL